MSKKDEQVVLQAAAAARARAELEVSEHANSAYRDEISRLKQELAKAQMPAPPPPPPPPAPPPPSLTYRETYKKMKAENPYVAALFILENQHRLDEPYVAPEKK
jgi:hypothetical protein